MTGVEKQDLTTGSLGKKILFFSLPLMCSNLLQVLFNMADVAVVGQFAGSSALGSVGSTVTLVFMFTGFLIGMAGGINVLTALYFGAKNESGLIKTVHSAAIVSLLTGVALLLIGVGFSEGILQILFFVIVCKMNVAGVAAASAISQYISAVLILIALFRCRDIYALRFSALRLDKKMALDILKIGLPAGMQNAIFQIANLFIQAGVNSFNAVTVAGNSAAANSDGMVYDVMAAFYTACGSFMGQNYGAKKKKRVLRSYFISLGYSFGIAVLMGIALVFAGPAFLGLFTRDAAVIDAGMNRLIIMGCSYCLSAFMDCTIAASRALGKSLMPTVIVIMGSCVFRIIWIYTIFAHFHTIPSLYLLYPFSWIITAIAEIIYFVKVYRTEVAAKQWAE